MTEALHFTVKTEGYCVAALLCTERISIYSSSNLSQVAKQVYIQHSTEEEARIRESDVY